MPEREAPQPQQPEIQTKAEKAAEEERAAAQEILEKLYDPFTNDDWLVHAITDEDNLERILDQGLLSAKVAWKAKEVNIPNIDFHSHYYNYQGYGNISAFGKDTPIEIWMGDIAVIFTPLKRDDEQGKIENEKLARLRVAPRRFKFLVVYNQAIGMQRKLTELKLMALQHKLPIIDSDFNLRYPLQIPAKELQEITIPSLRELTKTLGIEKLRAISVEEIRSAAGALAEK